MLNSNFHSKFLNNEIFLILILYFSLLISFYFGENSTGGAIGDYNGHNNLGIEFSRNFLQTLLNYNTQDIFQTRHSPIFIIFLGLLENVFLSDTLKRLFVLHIFLLLPFLF